MDFYFSLYRLLFKYILVEMVKASAKIIPIASIAICAAALIISVISIMRDERDEKNLSQRK